MKQQSSKTIELTPEILAELRAERDRTSVGPQALLKPYQDKPDGLNHPMITHWLGGRIKTAKREHVEFVRAAWSKLQSNRSIKITDELYNELIDMQSKSGINAEMMMRWTEASRVGLSVSKIKHVLSGKAKLMREAQVEFMRHVWGGDVGR